MSATGFKLSQNQMLAIRGRCLGWNVHKIGEVTGRVPSTLSEHLQRAYRTLGYNKIAQVIEWAKETGNLLTEKEFVEQYGKNRVTPVEEIKAKKAEETLRLKILKAQSEAMSEVHEEVGNNIHARY